MELAATPTERARALREFAERARLVSAERRALADRSRRYADIAYLEALDAGERLERLRRSNWTE